MKVLHLISSSGFYGAESVVLNLLSGLKKDGEEPYLVCLKNTEKDNPELHNRAKEAGISAYVYGCRMKFDMGAIMRLAAFVKREKIELLHAHGYKGDIYGFIAARLAGVPVVSTLHLWTGEDAKVSLYEKIDRYIVRKMDKLIPVSPALETELKKMGIGEHKIKLILNGVDTGRYAPENIKRVDKSEIVIGNAGRLFEQKGQTFLLKAMKKVLEVYPSARLVIWGEGPLREQLEKEAKELGIKEALGFKGFESDMRAVYASMDIFVMPSLDEGVPMALLEAMSMGLPVVATEVGGVPHVLGDGGVLVKPGDVEGLAEGILRVISGVRDSRRSSAGDSPHPGTVSIAGSPLRQRVKAHFSLDACYGKYKEVYSEVLNGIASPRSLGARNDEGKRRNDAEKNILTIDVEEYFQVENFKGVIARDEWDKCESRVVCATEKILDLLAKYKTKATFFVLGWIAERHPELVKKIRDAGHEIASHGYEHKLIYSQSPHEYRDDLRKANSILEGITGEKVLGYRAPSYSVTERSRWALDVLAEEGFRYDSSVFPIAHDRGGLPGAGRYPYVRGSRVRDSLRSSAGDSPHPGTVSIAGSPLWEIPLSTRRIAGKNVPFSGGGYFRLLPYAFIKKSIELCNRDGAPAVMYLHPWEFDPEQPKVKASLLGRFRHYVNLDKTEAKLERLLRDFRFTTVKGYLNEKYGIASSQSRANSKAPRNDAGQKIASSQSRANSRSPRNDAGQKIASSQSRANSRSPRNDAGQKIASSSNLANSRSPRNDAGQKIASSQSRANSKAPRNDAGQKIASSSNLANSRSPRNDAGKGKLCLKG